MPLSCPKATTWMYNTFVGLVQSVHHTRFVSTTSAINRGLRATKQATEGRQSRRDEKQKESVQDRGRNSPERGARQRVRSNVSDRRESAPPEIEKYTTGDGNWTNARWTGAQKEERKALARTIQDKRVSARSARNTVSGISDRRARGGDGDLKRGGGRDRSLGKPTRGGRTEPLRIMKFTSQDGDWTDARLAASHAGERTALARTVQDRQKDARIAQSMRGNRGDEAGSRRERSSSASRHAIEIGPGRQDEGNAGRQRRVERSPSKPKVDLAKLSQLQEDRLFDLDPTNSTSTSSKKQRSSKAREDNIDDQPLSTPYTTSSSTFLYGTNTVLAALKAHRRQIYKLHANSNFFELTTTPILQLAHSLNIPIKHNASPQLLDKLSQQRPHNGFVLETSMLPAAPVLSLGKPSETGSTLLELAHQSKEAVATNGQPTHIPNFRTRGQQYPLILMLDGILDPGNLGGLLRSAHFFGVTAVAISTATCANINSPVVAKASSGACEAVPVLALPKPADFVAKSRANGWKIWAAVAPSTESPRRAGRRPKHVTTSQLALGDVAPLGQGDGAGPPILILGAEGEGLRGNLLNKADYLVSISSGPKSGIGVGVDSLNVSVAGGVLMEAFMRSVKSDNGSKSEKVGKGERPSSRTMESADEEMNVGYRWRDGNVKIEM